MRPMPPRRRFTLLDALALTAAAAVGLGLIRDCLVKSTTNALVFTSACFDRPLPPVKAFVLTSPCLAALTLGLLALRLRRPRPPRRRLARQPGLVASAAATLALLLGGAAMMLALVLQRRWYPASIVGASLLPPLAGAAVAASWLTLGLAAGLRPEPSWIDRLGRLLGVLWIVQAFACIWISFT